MIFEIESFYRIFKNILKPFCNSIKPSIQGNEQKMLQGSVSDKQHHGQQHCMELELLKIHNQKFLHFGIGIWRLHYRSEDIKESCLEMLNI